ncbi:serine/threonine-protein kinase [Mycolicibacterium thermoresistibile]
MQAPEKLGDRYELRRVIGHGGMAEVRDGWDMRLQRAIAVKLLHPVLRADPANRRRFDLEARAAAGLNHPHVVAVHDSGDEDGTPYIVMERLPGPTLADEIAHGPLPPERVRRVLDQLLSALDAAHSGGIVHRDIKPGNILFTAAGDVKVGDFGIAKSPAVTMTEAGQVFGTLGYLSAERMAGRPATATDDLYAVGVVGYEALTGHRPYPQQNMTDLVRAVSEGRFTPLATLRPDIDASLAATIDRALAPDPHWRFGSAAQMRTALWQPVPRPATAVLSQPLPPPPTVAVPAVQPAAVQPRALVFGAAAAVAILIAVIFLAIDSGVERPLPAQPVGTSTVVPPAPAYQPPSPQPPSPQAPSLQDRPMQGPPVWAEQIKPGNGPGNNGKGKGRGPKNDE